MKRLSLCCFPPEFCCPSKVLIQCIYFAFTENNSRKRINNKSLYLLPHHCWVYFLGKQSLSRFVQEETPTQTDTQPHSQCFCLQMEKVQFCLALFSALDVLPYRLWAQELQFPAFWEIHPMLNKGAGRLSASFFSCCGRSSCSVGGRGAAPGRFYSSELCNPPLHCKLKGTAGDTAGNLSIKWKE